MDETTIKALLDALTASPENVTLRVTIVKLLLDGGAHTRALELATGEAPEVLILRARALHALNDQPAALAAYEAAVRTNPTLEDRDLRLSLGTVEKLHEEDGVRLRVLSNDDTDASEVDRLLHPEPTKVTFADVGGLDEIKTQIEKRIILPFQKPALFAKFKKKAGGGILLYGPPGCGKTLLARATAGQCNATFLNVAIEDVLDMWIGESERKLHALFEKARATTPAVLFFDEIEALAGKRQYTREATASKLVSQFLSEMDGFAKNNAGVLILAASNVPWAIDSAFRRPGRFDRVLFVPPPDRAARSSILKILLNGRPVADDIDTDLLATRTSGFSGADLENLVDTAADRAIADSLSKSGEVPINHSHLLAALAEIKPTTSEWLTTARNYARYANEGGQYDDVLAFLAKHTKK
ncbi:MAG TPA: ATP-binding protein [Kofleriaceae bacterium]|nr:ATP-binding protein [Kofleriaceae bacterium]